MKPVTYPRVKQGLYEISEDGQIWSNYKKGFLIPRADRDGYLQLALSGGSRGKKIYVRIATLVAWEYLKPPPSTMLDPTINHKDGNRLNNHYTNLEWMERGRNSSIRQNKGVGSANHEAKLNESQVKEICELLINTNISYKELAEKYHISKSTLSSIKNQKIWKNITSKYDFSCRIITRNELGYFEGVNSKFLKTPGEV